MLQSRRLLSFDDTNVALGKCRSKSGFNINRRLPVLLLSRPLDSFAVEHEREPVDVSTFVDCHLLPPFLRSVLIPPATFGLPLGRQRTCGRTKPLPLLLREK